MTNVMDQSLCPGYYFDYPDDETAKQRELELIENYTAGFLDDIFPPNARSLYLDPLNPPKGALPNESIRWFSISEGGLLNCDNPILFKEDAGSANILQGALGNNYFINALSLLACAPKFINRLIVSSKYASRGLYTFKFYKSGKWRYVHIDDNVPCRQSGKVHFCRNANPNETFAMLLEKAYAKLHGCYEALSYGLVEHALMDLTPAAGIQSLKLEEVPRPRLCDEAWDAMEACISKGALIGCARFVQDPASENPAIRQGIDVGVMYQVVDICITSAEPTEDYDALTVGMVCVRNLKSTTGRFNGRWSFGHKLWLDYKEIALDLRHRTREIQHKRGIGDHPDEMPQEARLDTRYLSAVQPLEMGGDEIDNEDEADTIDGGYQERRLPFKMVQPMADDLHWIQIEDFVDIFSRIFVVNDLGFEKKFTTKRFVSKWLPGDYLVGSGGPPIVIERHELPPEEGDDQMMPDVGLQSQSLLSSSLAPSDVSPGPATSSPPKGLPPPASLSVPRPVRYQKVAFLSESFTDNPMYPFTVAEPARAVITMYQLDQRWNVGRLGDDPTAMPIHRFIPRQERLESVMQYPVGIAFVLVRLSGMKVRLTDFKLRKIAYATKRLVFAPSNNVYVDLFPGRYAIIPYTHCILDRAMDYALHVQYLGSQLEFEVEDPIVQRLQDREASEDGVDEENEPDDNDLLQVTNEDNDDVSILSYDRVLGGDEDGGGDGPGEDDHDTGPVLRPSDMRQQANGQKVLLPSGGDDTSLASSSQRGGGGGGGGGRPAVHHVRMVPLPRLLRIHPWEYHEEVDELAMMHMYGEVGNMMKYLRSLRGEIRKLNGTIRALTMTDRGQNIMVNNSSNNNNPTPMRPGLGDGHILPPL